MDNEVSIGFNYDGGKTLIVGGGLTGAALARLLKEAKAAVTYASDVVIWDRNSILGGRAMARSFPKQREVHVDMGAQYWTPKSDYNDDFRQKLTQSGRLVPFAENEIAQDPYKGTVKMHLVSPDGRGFRAMVEHLLEGMETKLSTHLESFQVLDDKRIQVTTNEGEEEIVNELVLTCPIPISQEEQLVSCCAGGLRALEGVAYSQRFAAAYVFDEKAVPAVQELGWTAKYVPGDESDIIRFKKQGKTSPPALIVHTSVAFGATFMDDTRHNDEVLAIITKSLREVLPSLPAAKDARLHRWRITCCRLTTTPLSMLSISQVTVPYHDPSSAIGEDPVSALVLSTNPRIIVAGDSFLGSGFDNCLVSAKTAASLLQSNSAL
ncbi:FAD/NAD(P)-binding domain [Phytophthora cactorum]|nr:FAD/NAD(P)-binding domain [Phytophthora cactorum]